MTAIAPRTPAEGATPRGARARISPGRAALLVSALLAACSSTAVLPAGADRLDAASEALRRGRYDEALDLAAPLLSTDEAPARDRAEAAFVIGEAHMALENHGQAYPKYVYILENAPWSPRQLPYRLHPHKVSRRSALRSTLPHRLIATATWSRTTGISATVRPARVLPSTTRSPARAHTW